MIPPASAASGTPCRLNGRTIDYSQCELQPGDNDPEPFSFLTDEAGRRRIATNQIPCWITHTNQAVHELIRANLHRAPMYSGQIQSRGAASGVGLASGICGTLTTTGASRGG